MADPIPPERILDTTTNRLKEFDLVASLALSSINAQLADAWKKWHHKSAGLNVCTMELLKDSEDGDPANDTRYELNLRLSAPLVSVDPARQSLHDVVVTFEISSGTITKMVGKRIASLDMSGRRFWFNAELVQNRVQQEQLYQVDAETAKTIAALSGPAGAGALTIECLFLNLTSIDVVTGFDVSPIDASDLDRRFKYEGYAPKFVAKPENLVSLRKELEDQFALFMRDHFASGRSADGRAFGQFLLNTTLRPHQPKAEASLLINDIRFKVTKASAQNSNAYPNSIDYLATVVNGRTMPADGGPLDNALISLASWLTPSRLDGTEALTAGMMALRGGRVAKLVAEIFQRALPEQYKAMSKANAEAAQKLGRPVTKPEVEKPYPEAELLSMEPATWNEESGKVFLKSRDSDNTYSWKGREDDNDVTFNLKKSLNLELTPVPYEGYVISGLYKIELSRKRDTVWGNVDAWANTEANITGTVVFHANSDGLSCEISPQISITIENGNQTSSSSDSNFLVTVFNDREWDKNQAIGFSDAIREAIRKMLEEAFQKLNLRLKDFCIIPPGGEAFAFSKPRISNSGDLFLDLVYRTSLKPK